jgi:hypothetical protein
MAGIRFADAAHAATAVSGRCLAGAALLCMLTVANATGVSAQETKGVRVCLGTDNVLRFTSGTRCPQGQRMFRLAEVEDEVGIARERDDPPNAVVTDLKTRVDFLTRRVANLEAEARRDGDGSAQSRVLAPFEVVDRQGNPLFVVTDADYPSATRRGRVHIGRATGGTNYSILVRNQGGAVVAAMGEGKETGSGSIQVNDNAGKLRARLFADEGLKIFNTSGLPVATILTGEQGAGQFWLYDASGTAMVKAGTTGPGVGIVQAGPGVKCVPTTLRVPDCLRGRTQ